MFEYFLWGVFVFLFTQIKSEQLNLGKSIYKHKNTCMFEHKRIFPFLK
jgi:hypothetical protein